MHNLIIHNNVSRFDRNIDSASRVIYRLILKLIHAKILNLVHKSMILGNTIID